ncbi:MULTISPECIES: AAA family ATPase [Rothia]|uniref:AAA family ATPase n=1 Tax=Rothia TaxID=32207 RepID=UPI0009F28962|nr:MULTISPECIES: AAA family ATPase [Rothia]
MVDATKVSSIKIDTGYDGVKEYPFFTRESKNGQALPDARCAIVLGKNGSGKSTIARSMSLETRGTEFFDVDGKSLGRNCSNVHVFNEMYVIENFRIYDSSHLEPVILLGENATIINEIDVLKKEISEIEKNISQTARGAVNQVWSKYDFASWDGFLSHLCKMFVDACLENELDIGSSEESGYMHLGETLLEKAFRSSDIDDVYFNRWLSLEFSQGGNRSKYVDDSELILSEGDLVNLENEIEDIYNEICFAASKKVNGQGDSHERVAGDIRLFSLRRNYVKSIMRVLRVKDYSLYTDLSKSRVFIPGVDRMRQEKELRLSKSETLKNMEKRLERKRHEDSTALVVKNMNQWLRVIFGEDVLQIEADGEYGYRVKKRGREVLPNRLSLGEQNILALCYFFVDISDGERTLNIAHKNQIIILDDPLSSFDYDNKYGVIQILDYVSEIVAGNSSKAKIVIMTHDPAAALEISKSIIYRINGSVVKCCEIIESQGECIREVNFGNIDEYRNILKKMFDIAVRNGGDIELLSPNEVRRVWEAFLRFELGESKISGRSALDRVACFYDNQSAEYEFLKSFISYVYINQDSHSSDQMLFGNFELMPILGRHDFEKHIRQIILFMRLVAPHHIPSRLTDKLREIVDYRDSLEALYRVEVLGQS